MNDHDDEIRLSGTSFAVLGLVQLLGEATPYELKAALEASVANFWPVPHTTFYVEPARLAKAGYLTEEQEEGGRRRKRYRLTERGGKALEEWVGEFRFTPPEQRDEQTLKVFLGADPVPLMEARLEWHHAKLAELEGYLAAVRATGKAEGFGSKGAERALVGGVFYHRTLAEALERVLRDGPEEFEQ
jgi:DNA-binding PadR family transcriptional regulator